MSLSLGTGPLAGQPGGAFNFDLSEAPAHRIFFSDYPRRLRAVVGDRVVLDTTAAKLLYETGIPPVPYVPLADFDQALLERTDHSTHCPFKGDASYWTVRAGAELAARLRRAVLEAGERVARRGGARARQPARPVPPGRRARELAAGHRDRGGPGDRRIRAAQAAVRDRAADARLRAPRRHRRGRARAGGE